MNPTFARTAGRVWAVVAIIEAFTWLGLLIGMFLKYVTQTTDLGVTIFGRLHGGAFVVYVVVTIVAAIALRWRWWVTVVAVLASIPPLATIPLEIVLARRGMLKPRPVVTPIQEPEPVSSARVS